MKTAEEILENEWNKNKNNCPFNEIYVGEKIAINNAMIEFAKYHVEKALDSASKKSKVDLHVRKDKKGAKYKLVQNGEEYDLFRTVQMYKVNKCSILNAYSLENIK